MAKESIQRVLEWLGRVITEPRHELTRWQAAVRFAYDLGRYGARQLRRDQAPQMAAALDLPGDMRFDLCLFWDLFDFLEDAAVSALQDVLRPHLHPASMGHGFAAHNARVRPPDRTYAIKTTSELAVRSLPEPRPGYVARGQGPLKSLLSRFTFGRTVLLPDKRLEFLISMKL